MFHSGMPAAYLTTPCGEFKWLKRVHASVGGNVDDAFIDVVKTRLQTEARKGQSNYKGVVDAFGKICKSAILAIMRVLLSPSTVR